ncbi:MAG: hypothetical protein K0S33_3096 [Bacteroidetes bacterium]|jgi:hypothetical protein|nr:hypothetical protein [Bacteroidota bacterium]
MKRIFLILVFSFTCLAGFSQPPAILIGRSAPLSGLQKDTTYYESGLLRTVTRYAPHYFQPFASSMEKEIKTIYQFDECGNLRNKTVFYSGGNPAMYGILGPTLRLEDHIVRDVACDKEWGKPVIVY